MAIYVLDFSILLELYDPHSAWHHAVRDAVDDLCRQGHTCVVDEAGLMQLWSLLTRSAMLNGYNMSLHEAKTALHDLLDRFGILEAPHPVDWIETAETHALVGEEVRTARLLATMQAAGATHLLTTDPLDVPDEARIEVIVLDPAPTL